MNNHQYPKWVYWIPAFIWMIVIFSLSARPSIHASAIDWQDFFIKKTAHVVEYFILAFLIYFSLRKTTVESRTSLLLYTIIITIIYAVTDEFHQTFVPGREGRLRDVLIDSSGAFLFVLLRRFKPS
jgi:cell division protein FtsW (lipid II flippase)